MNCFLITKPPIPGSVTNHRMVGSQWSAPYTIANSNLIFMKDYLRYNLFLTCLISLQNHKFDYSRKDQVKI